MTTRPDPLREVRALRDRLYRPGATEQDRLRYEAALADEEPAADVVETPARRRVRHRVAVVAAVVGAVVLAAAAIGTGVLLARPPYPTVASTPIELLGSPADQAGARADLVTVFNQRDPFLGLYLARHRTTLSASIRSDSIGIDGRGTGPTTVSLKGILSDGQSTGLMTVLFVCDRPGTAYSWVLEGPADRSGRPVRTGASGPDCGSGIVTATFVPAPHHVPTRIRITVPDGVRSVVEVDLSKY